MQTSTSRPGSLQMAQKSSSSTPRVVRKLKVTGSDSDSPSPVSKMTKDNKSSKVIDRRSPRNLITEKKKPITRVSELESQLSHLQDELQKTKDQLTSSESLKRKAELEADEAKRHLAATSAELQETRIQLDEISESEDSRLQELRKLSHDRDRAWQSELEAVQKQHELQSAALSSAINEIQKLKAQLERAREDSTRAEAELEESRDRVRSLEGKMSVVEKTGGADEELLESLRTEVQNLQAELEAAERSYRDEYIQSTLEIRNAYELVERAKSESNYKVAELKSMLDESKTDIQELTEKEIELELNSETLESTLRDLTSKLYEKSLEIERMAKENELLKSEMEKKEVERRKIEHEGLIKLSALTEEASKSGKRAERAAEQLDATQVSHSELEAELRRLKVQSDQWRKAAEVATAMLSVNGKRVDYHVIGGKLGSENGGGDTDDDECGADEESGKKRNGNNVLRKIGELLKKGQK